MHAKDALGKRGEEAAARHLAEQHGWWILDRNWRCDDGELDIVAYDGHDFVACEVKTRSDTRFGTPAEAITPAKAARLRRLARRWLAEHVSDRVGIRVDVVGLVRDGSGHFTIDHLRGVC